MKGRKTRALSGLLLAIFLVLGVSPIYAGGPGGGDSIRSAQPARAESVTLAQAQGDTEAPPIETSRVTQSDRTAAAANARAAGFEAAAGNPLDIGPGDQPDYFGMPNYANSPLPQVVSTNPAPVWYFAEGTCRTNFDPYFTIQNPGALDADVVITYMKGDGTSVRTARSARQPQPPPKLRSQRFLFSF